MMNVRCLQFNPKETMTLLRKRLESLNCSIVDRMHILELLKDDEGTISGAVGLMVRTGELVLIRAGAIVIASGPLNIKGRNMADNVGADGHALALRAGAELSDMEFAFGGTFSLMKHHYKFPAYNIALGHGARLINAKGERFMERYDPERLERGELPQVIAAFLNENLCGRGPVYIDLRYADEHLVEDLQAVRGSVWANELTTGRIKDFRERPILIEPQWTVWSHRAGIRIDLKGNTNVKGLLAAGSVVKIECVGTHASAGVPVGHACVSGARAGKSAAEMAMTRCNAKPSFDSQVKAIIERLGRDFSQKNSKTANEIYKNIRQALGTPLDCMIFTAKRLLELQSTLKALEHEARLITSSDIHELVKIEEVRNFIQAFLVSIASALAREESRESFFRSDYPETDNENWFCWHVAKLTGDSLSLRREAIPLENYPLKPRHLVSRQISTIGKILEEALNGQRIH